MAVLFFNVFSGKWEDPSSWLGGEAPTVGDTAVVGHGVFFNSTVELSFLTIAGQSIDVVAANQLSFTATTLDANSSLNNSDTDGLTLSFAMYNVFDGPVLLSGPTDMYLIPGVTSLLVNKATMTVAAPTVVMGEGVLVNSGTINIGKPGDAGAVVSFHVPSFAVQTQNDGLITVTGAAGAPVSNTTATFENVIGFGTFQASNAEVTFLGSVAAGRFEFTDAKAVLQLNNAGLDFDATIAGYQLGNRIDLGSTAVDSVAFVSDPGDLSGTLQLFDGGSLVNELKFEGTYTTSDFVLSDIGGDVSLSVPCFAQGTLLLTARGEVAVEALAVGDVLPTRLGGESALVAWMGWRRVDCRRHPRPQDVMPVRVRKGAFGEGVPARDVVLSPDHAVFEGGVLIPVRYLVNDATIVQEDVPSVTYWHVELERHDVVSAAGLAVESYLDTGNRGDFANGTGAVKLHPDFRPADPVAAWDGRACAPLRLEGREVEAAQLRLLARARAMGWRMAAAVAPVVLVDGRAVSPVRDGGLWLVPPPRGARRLELVSGAGVPERLRPGSGDGRVLGVAIAAPMWDGVAAGLDDARFVSGWHAAEDALRWSDGRGVIDVAGLADVAFTLVDAEAHWAGCPLEVAA
jgi:hypothetical protein